MSRFVSNLELQWEDPAERRYFERLASFCAECCPSIKMAADLRWDGSTVSAQNVRRLN
jgi:hypothetical protein